MLSGGSTPSLAASLADDGPPHRTASGVYVFGDAQQLALGSMSDADLALTCRSTVVSHAGGRLVVDAGSKMLGADRPAYTPGAGAVLGDPGAVVVQLSEHHAVLECSCHLPAIGIVIDLVHNHV